MENKAITYLVEYMRHQNQLNVLNAQSLFDIAKTLSKENQVPDLLNHIEAMLQEGERQIKSYEELLVSFNLIDEGIDGAK